jgi:hypothetical protein
MAKDIDRDSESIQQKPEPKKLKDTSRRLRQGRQKPLSHRATLEWRLDQRRVCEVNGADAEIVPIGELTEALLRSRTAAALLENTAHLSIVYDLQNPASQYYVRGDKSIITLNPLRPRGDLINLLARELRRDWQHRQGALVNPLNFEPDEAILVNRAQNADVHMVSVKIAWELKLAGEPEAWDFLTGSPLSDVTRTFEIKAQSDFRSLNSGEACRVAYDKFFEDSRTKLHDKRIIHQMLLDESGYMKAGAKRPKVTMDLFRRLGEVPHGRNYLAMKSARQPLDACYSTVEDRSNANFLWFIKFERSFQEKELQMIQESVKLSAEVVDFNQCRRARQSEPGT